MKFRAHLLATAFLPLLLAACDSAEDRAAAHFQSGLELLEQGEPAKAQLEFRNAIQLDPSHVEARFRLGEFQRGRNNVRGAVGQYRAVVELNPDHVDARRELAEIMLVANQLDEAERHIAVAFRHAAEDPRVRAIKASVDYKRGLTEDAVEMAREVLEETPGSTTARLVLIADAMDGNRLEEALEQAEIGLSHDDRDLSLNVVKLGVVEQIRDMDAVGEQLGRLVEFYPKADQFREAYARWNVFNRDFDAAEAQYRGIAANDPDNVEKALDVARFLNSIHGPERARAELERLAAQPEAPVDYDLAIAALDIQDGDAAAAAERLDAAIEARGASLGAQKARVERAKLHIRAEEWEQADAVLATVLAADPRNSSALLLRASRHLAADDAESAVTDLRAALDVAPRDVQVMQLLATAYERNGQRELALERMAQAVQVSDYDPAVTLRYAQSLLGDEKVAIAESLLNDALSRKGENRELLVAMGQIKLRRQDWRGAAQIASRLKTLDPDDAVAARMEAAALLGQRRFAEGADMLENLVGDTSGEDANMVSFVRALLAGGDAERARGFLEDRLERLPDDATALVMLASIEAAEGALDDAERHLKRAIEIEPGNAAAYASLARIYNSQGRDDLVSATLAQGLESNRDDVALRLTKAMQLEHDGRIDAAIELYDELYRLRPNSMVIANNFASLLADHRADDPAQLERAINIAKRFRDTDQPYLKDTYGWLLYLAGDPEGASRYVLSAAEDLAANPTVQYHAGMVLAALGNPAQARFRLSRALELSEQSPFPLADKARAELERLDAAAAQSEQSQGGGATTQ